MKFTLLFYTDNWESGPTVELASMPTTGSVVWVRGADRDDEGAMYYVDNIMHAERGIDVEDTVYLYVRPYTGYAPTPRKPKPTGSPNGSPRLRRS